MRSLSGTISRLQRFRSDSERSQGAGPVVGKLIDFGAFAPNPGNLRALIHVPQSYVAGGALVVVLHGCTQTAAGYDRGSGWSDLADRHGFAVLFAEQSRSNNANLCFNWFSAEDAARFGGEAESIRSMTLAAIDRHGVDRSRVFVTGLSAGGAMTSTMLATAPEVFAGGAIIAGLPHGVARDVPQAFDRMRGHGFRQAELSRLVRRASDHDGPWPSISVWHGTADQTVDRINAQMIIDQWRGVHDVHGDPAIGDVDGYRHRAWRDRNGRMVIEEHAIAGLGHGTPITALGDEAAGMPGPYMLEAGTSSTYRIAASWGLVPEVAPKRYPSPAPSGSDAASARAPVTQHSSVGHDVGQSIERALRAAGLIRS